MSLNAAPSSARTHIAFFGARNAGKSSLINAVTGQETAIVSHIKGTTTDPVYKTMELLPLGPVVLIDTPGIDDEGELGALRVRRARQVLNKTDAAVLVADAALGLTAADEELIELFREKDIPYIVALNKTDAAGVPAEMKENWLSVSAVTGAGVHELKERLAALCASEEPKLRLVADLLAPGDFVVLVVPIDKAAPKGRLILPQQQVIRDVLETGAVSVVVREVEYKAALEALGRKPALVVTDSQAFAQISAETPSDVPLTSFSILFARYKGVLGQAMAGAAVLETLADGDNILIAEGCTHHRQCDDIGTVKLPKWIRGFTGKTLDFTFVSGGEFPEDVTGYKLAVHCGGCMLNNREVLSRAARCGAQNVPFVNYGVIIARMNGILSRCTGMFDV